MFLDNNHEEFYKKKLKELKYKDSYSKSLIYLISMCEETRKHFETIYNMEKNEININCLNEAWQTSYSLCTCRLAFNLFNGLASDNPEIEMANSKYNVSSIFCNKNSRYYFEAIKIRFPEYV